MKQTRLLSLLTGACWTLAVGSAIAQAPGVSCLLAPSLEINVGTPIEGVLQEVRVDRGDLVQKGQLLARLNDSVEAASVAHVEAKLAYGGRRVERNEGLRQQQLISEQELDDIETERRLAELELRERKEQLRLRSINSPIRGVVVERFRAPGDLVSRERIFKLAQLDPLHVEAVVPAERFGTLQRGQRLPVRLQVLSREVTATVSQIDRVIDAASGTFRVRLTLPNPNGQIPAGLRCELRH